MTNVTASVEGASVGGDASQIGTGLKSGIYTCTYTTGDPLIFSDFTIIKYADITLGGLRPDVVAIDPVTANRVNLTGSALNDGRVTAFVVGTP